MPSSQASRLNRPVKTSFDEPLDTRKTRRTNVLSGAMLAFFASVICSYLGLVDLIPVLRNAQYTGLVFLFLGAWLGARHFKIVLAFSGAVALLLLIVAYTPLAKKMATPLIMQTAPQEIARGADAVMVLGSWVQKDSTLTNVSMPRLMRGIELMRQNQVPILIVSEIAPPAGSYSKAARRIAAQLKIPLNVQPLPGYMGNTRDEAVNFAALAKSKGWKRVFLVTSPTHTRRATLMFRRAAQGQKLQILSVPSTELNADLATLDDPGDRINVFKMCLRERVGLWIYERRGWV